VPEITKCADSRALIMGRARAFDHEAGRNSRWSTLKKALAMLCCITRANPTLRLRQPGLLVAGLEDASAVVKKKNDNVVFRRAHGTYGI
jgi:hypothetical protein